MKKSWVSGLLASQIALALVVVNAQAQAQSDSGDAASAQPATSDQSSKSEPVQLDQITVSAQRRKQSLQDTPLSVSVRNGTDLLDTGKYSLKSILEDVPGISGGAAEATATMPGAASGGTDSPSSGITIRGISSSRGAGSAGVSTAAAVATYVDDVYEGVGGNYDIDHLELLRGPQGTLYGRSATAGVVAIHTRDPDLGTTSGDASIERGNYDLGRYAAAFNLPVIDDKLAVRVSANRYERDGFDNGKDGRLESTDGRLKVLWKPTDDISVLFGAAMQKNDQMSGGRSLAPTSDPDATRYTDISVLPSENEFRQYWANLQWDLGFGTLTYIPAYRSWTQNAHISLVAEGNEVNTTSITPDDTFVTHELRLSSPLDSPLSWTMGTLWYRNHLSNYSSNYLPAYDLVSFSADTRKKTEALGIFGELTYPLSDTLRATAGIRYDKTKVDIQQDYTSIAGITSSIPADQQNYSFNNVTYRARLDKDLSRDSMVYASISTGFSPGDASMQADANGVPQVVVLKAETLTSYEIGSKNRFLDGRLTVNGDLFYNDYGGYQTTLSVNVNEFRSFNVPMRTWGGELELQFRPTIADTIGLNVGYVNARYVDIPEDFASVYALDTPSSVIPWKANGSYSHDFELPDGSLLTLRGDVDYIGRRRSPATSFPESVAELGGTEYVTFNSELIGNLSATWRSSEGRYSLTGYVRNVGNERYKISEYVLGTSMYGELLARSDWTFQPVLSDPRTYGLSFGVSF